MWGQEVYGKSLYFPLNFAVNLTLLFKKKKNSKTKTNKQVASWSWPVNHSLLQLLSQISFISTLANDQYFLKYAKYSLFCLAFDHTITSSGSTFPHPDATGLQIPFKVQLKHGRSSPNPPGGFRSTSHDLPLACELTTATQSITLH